MINIHHPAKKYKTVEALKGVTLDVAEGELFAYLGPNGSGKTTTIRILTGLARPTSGDATLHGFHILREPLEARRQCGLVPQTLNLDNELTVLENLDIHGRLFNMPRRERQARIDEMLLILPDFVFPKCRHKLAQKYSLEFCLLLRWVALARRRRLTRGLKSPAFRRLLFQSAVQSADLNSTSFHLAVV